MAKELPYFKFEPNAWDNGGIQMCNKTSKGVFIDICSTYWSRSGELPYALALQKHCNGDASIMQELIKYEIIIVENDQIIIEFLDEQLNEFLKTNEKRANAANKRWKDANAMQMQSKSNAIREDKIREDKIREDNSKENEPIVYPFDSENFNSQWLLWKDYKKKEFKFAYKTDQSEQAALTELNNLATGNEQKAIAIIHQSMANGWKGFFQLKNNNQNGTSNNTNGRNYSTAQSPNELAEWLNSKHGANLPKT